MVGPTGASYDGAADGGTDAGTIGSTTDTTSASSGGSAGAGGTTTGAGCVGAGPVDATALVPQEIAIDQGSSSADPLGDINGDGLG